MKSSFVTIMILGLGWLSGCTMTRTVSRIPYTPAANAATGLSQARPLVLMPLTDRRPDTLKDPERGPRLFAALAIFGYMTEKPIREEVRGMLAAYLRRAGIRDIRLAPRSAAGPDGKPRPQAKLPPDALVIGGVLRQFGAFVPGNPHRPDVRAKSKVVYILKAYLRDQRAGCVIAEETFVGLGKKIADPGTEFLTRGNVDDELLTFTVSGLDRWFRAIVGPSSRFAVAAKAGVCVKPTKGKAPIASH